MTPIKLAHVQRFTDRHGKVRHYYRRPGYPRAPLPGAAGSAEFMQAYYSALRLPRGPPGEVPSQGTISAMIVAYYRSDEWANLQTQTQRSYRRILDAFRVEHGDKRASLMEPMHLKAILDGMSDRPEAARNLLKRLRGVFAFGLSRGMVPANPTTGVKLVKRKTEGFRAWIDSDIEQFERRWPSGSRARLALYLLLYTGQRRSDVVRMGRQHLRDGLLHVRQAKTGVELKLPLHAKLQAELDLLPADQLTFLITAYGKPMSAVGFSNWFVDCARNAGLPRGCSPHGLRKAAGRRLAEAGCTAHQIMAITGHQSLKEVERYTRTARQEQLAISAMAQMTNG